MCNDNLSNTRGELFGPDIREKIMDRASTIEAFSKAITLVDKPAKPGASNGSHSRAVLPERLAHLQDAAGWPRSSMFDNITISRSNTLLEVVFRSY